MKIPFKYKLSFSISLIVIGILTAVFVSLEADMEEDALLRVKDRLATTQEVVLDLIEERLSRLNELATCVCGSEGIHDLFTDPDLQPGARDDIVEKQILSSYPRLSLLCVIGRDGKILVANTAARRLQASLINTKAFEAALRGVPGRGFIVLNRQCIQIAAIPVRFDSLGAGQGGAIVLVGMTWLRTDLARIQDLSGVQIALFQEGLSILSTGMPFGRGDVAEDLTEGRLRSIWQISTSAHRIARVDGERFLFLRVPNDPEVFPPFVIAKSLDAELTLLDQVHANMVNLGLAGIGLAIGVSLFFGLKISRPLGALLEAAEKVKAGDFEHRAPVKGQDEFSQLSLSFNRMVEGLQERDYIRNTFGRYVDPDVAQELLKRPETAAMGGKRRDVAILMADIRGFTAICEELSPATTLTWLNAYFSHIIAVIMNHHGIIIDFVGDAVLAFFDPLEAMPTEAAGRAVQCAFDMQRQVAVFNREKNSHLFPEVQIGIGVNAGTVIVGNIGSEDRTKYGIVGSAVNITQRIQEHAGPGEIVVSESLLAQAGESVRVLRSFRAQLKGIRAPVALFTVVPADGDSGKQGIG